MSTMKRYLAGLALSAVLTGVTLAAATDIVLPIAPATPVAQAGGPTA